MFDKLVKTSVLSVKMGFHEDMNNIENRGSQSISHETMEEKFK
jgi:hypothetical protein